MSDMVGGPDAASTDNSPPTVSAEPVQADRVRGRLIRPRAQNLRLDFEASRTRPLMGPAVHHGFTYLDPNPMGMVTYRDRYPVHVVPRTPDGQQTAEL